jgi:ABC-type branched-subunit amino acid transport system substrate-binding protein
MPSISDAFRRLQERWPLRLILIVGGAVGVLVIAAIVGAIVVSDNGTKTVATKHQSTETTAAAPSAGAAQTETPTSALPGTSPAAATGTTARRGTTSNSPTAGSYQPTTNVTLPSSTGATKVGIGNDFVKWGLHAPQTFNGVPLPLAADPLEGVGIYLTELNNAGGINGRKIQEVFADDRYTTDGAQQAADKLVNDAKVFFISGTLGVDQVAAVARAASESKPAPTPYMAAGASETQFKAENIKMWQVGASYDTALSSVAKFLAQQVKQADSIYFGKKRIAVSALDSKYVIAPVKEMQKVVQSTPGLEWAGYVTVPKYTDPSNTHNYADQIQKLKAMKPDIVIPAQDPLTTQLEVSQCLTQGCTWKWSWANFAHDEDLALQLANNGAGLWDKVRGLSGGCYYQDYNKGYPCGQLKAAHEKWVGVKGEQDWVDHGQSGVAGYQIVHFWMKALKEAGADLTRERFAAALNTYDRYDDLVSGPLTFARSQNTVHGGELWAVYEGQRNDHWKMISKGLVGPF